MRQVCWDLDSPMEQGVKLVAEGERLFIILRDLEDW